MVNVEWDKAIKKKLKGWDLAPIIKKIFGLIGIEIKRIPSISKHIAFLHISKTAGTQIMYVANQLNDYGVNIKKYHQTLKNLAPI